LCYTVADGTVTQLTDDEFADLHPAWSPDGKTIAFASDRFTTSLEDLTFGPVRVALLDVETRTIRPLTGSSDGGKQISPQWSPDGKAIYYVADPDGVSNIYRVELETGDIRRVTSESSGISGITSTSPALAVASSTGKLAFSAYRDGHFEIQTLEQTSAQSAPIVTAGRRHANAIATPARQARGIVIERAFRYAGRPHIPDREVRRPPSRRVDCGSVRRRGDWGRRTRRRRSPRQFRHCVRRHASGPAAARTGTRRHEQGRFRGTDRLL
jgi:Tol biopolymer transport system component